MGFRGYGRRALSVGVVVILLSGCGQVANAPLPQSAAQSRVHRASTYSGDLLYVIAGPSAQNVDFVTYPGGEPVGTITGLGAPHALCSDNSGNVWVGEDNGALAEFSHGGTTPIKTVSLGKLVVFTGNCSVDPVSGDVAFVLWDGNVYVYKNGTSSFTEYPAPAWDCAYDDKGNLFVDGAFSFSVSELPRGGTSFIPINLNKSGTIPDGNIQWDGHYMAVGTVIHKHRVIYRFTVSGSQGLVKQTVHLKGVDKVFSVLDSARDVGGFD